MSSIAAVAAAASGMAAADDGAAYVYVPSRSSSSSSSSTPADESTASSESPAAPDASTSRTVPHMPKPRVIFVLGGPGAGKGTQCGKLVKEYGFIHLSAGDLLRDERDSGSPDGEMIEQFIREGKIVPVEVTVNLIRKAMERSGATKFLVDGFPRNFNNLDGWYRVMGETAEVDGVLFYEVSEDVLVSRLLKRAESSGRSDDNIDTIIKRLKTYNDSTVPGESTRRGEEEERRRRRRRKGGAKGRIIAFHHTKYSTLTPSLALRPLSNLPLFTVIDHYAKQGKVTRIFGGDPVDTVFARTSAAVEPVIAAEVLGYNKLLLDAISFGDWSAYEALVDPGVTCFEPEAAADGLVRGTAFHKAIFEKAAAARASASAAGKPAPLYISTMHEPDVTLLGPRHALITYTRLISAAPSGASSSSSSSSQATPQSAVTRVSESRVWSLSNGKWKMIHFHRSKQA
jgi:UMP-CMP kinase